MAQRVWLDWHAPALPAAVQWLIGRGSAKGEGRTCDLERTIVVLPGRRSGRLLMRRLVEGCSARGLHLIPPRALTPGPLVDLLVPVDVATATAAEAALAWLKVLREADAGTLARLLPLRPADEDLPAWHDLGATIAALHEELAGQQVAFEDVAKAAEELGRADEAERWRVLDALGRAYHQTLGSCGLTDAYRARHDALANADRQAIDCDIVLLGVVDFNRTQRAALELNEARTTALVHAPPELADHFDALGCLRFEAWPAVSIDVPDGAVVVADRPEDQAQATVRCVAALAGQFAADEIAVGLADPALAASITRAGHWAAMSLRPAAGRPLDRTGPYRLIAAAAELVRDGRFQSLAALVRHPDVTAWMDRRSAAREPTLFAPDWPATFDRLAAERLPAHLDDVWQELAAPPGKRTLSPLVLLRETLARCFPAGTSAPLSTWAERALDLLVQIYGDLDAAGEAATAEACAALHDPLVAFASAPPALQPHAPVAVALHLLLAAARTQTVPEPIEAGQIEMLGWLELHLDDAPALVIAGFNEGCVPQAVGADPFLPGALRRRLGLLHDDARLARDAYLLEAIRRSRRAFRLVAGRRSAEGDLLTPSRLLLACGPDRLPERIDLLCDEKNARAFGLPLGAPSPQAHTLFKVPALPELPLPVQVMAVTSFSAYLACPYRYALKHLLRLRSIADGAVELDALRFGTLAHEVLHEFGRDEAIRASTEARALAAFLVDRLEERARALFGRRPLPAIAIQVARLRQRFEAFAHAQVKHATAGWRIVHVEYELPADAALDMGSDPPMRLRGRIDRIDRHDERGEWLILDYKTSEGGTAPERAHHRRDDSADGWFEVQLPLYWHLAGCHGFEGPVRVGYANLPSESGAAAVLTAGWSDEQLGEGVEMARRVVRSIRAGRFERNPGFSRTFDDFARICQTRAFRDEEGGGEGNGNAEP